MESINPAAAGEDASAPALAPVVMDPSLLMAVSMGDCQALRTLLNHVCPTPVAPQVVVEVPDGSTITSGSSDVQHQEGASDQPAAPSAESLLEGVTPLGDTALHVVAKSGYSSRENLDCARVVYNKAKHLLDKPNNLGDTPLHFAARSGSREMVHCLLELSKGEDGGSDRVESFLRKQNMCGETALHDAIRKKNKDMVILLLTEDSQLARVPSAGMSPLYLAIFLEQYHIAIILHDEDNQLSYSGPDGQNALHVSVMRDTGTLLFLEEVYTFMQYFA
ncbi:transient receptor potential cation channel subfamily A member 1-like [Lolium rigidum]|uniref:transient receptor potential cation channel subfamily A member 1-like n=1 Tax=Lolium rigidum TaxID=89674 RepID=UPI001F5CE2A3|nr:transient receptor potential cation channel subfamily A member 1-like [Lolium rigidum]